jgi:hydrogenase expression/formation protein HypD
MKYIDEFRNKALVRKVSLRIKKLMPKHSLNFMEVCGTHTQSFFRFGLNTLLPQQLRLISGPGCPVCVCSPSYIDRAIECARLKNVIVVSFGDMLRVPGSNSSLEKEKAQEADVRIVYSAAEALHLAHQNPHKQIVFLAVGFETTIPTIALTILRAKQEKLKNLFFLCALKLIPPAMQALLKEGQINIQGFLCPGHVSAVIGTRPYEFIPRRYKIGCCIAGFEPLDILEGIYSLLKQVTQGSPYVENQYRRLVKEEGNLQAQEIIQQVFKVCDTDWRGLGAIPSSGLQIKEGFKEFDAQRIISLGITHYPLPITQKKCRCADVIKGIILPRECSLFARSCTPQSPKGPCMVSNEGACNAYFKYSR